MAIQIDYFLAPDDESALALLEEPAGPRSVFSDVVGTAEIDPGLALGYLHEVLTGTSFETYLDAQGPALLGESSDEQKVLLELDEQFVARLAHLEEPTPQLATRWADHEAAPEQEWNVDAGELRAFLDAFVALARRSAAGEGAVYCWLWP